MSLSGILGLSSKERKLFGACLISILVVSCGVMVFQALAATGDASIGGATSVFEGALTVTGNVVANNVEMVYPAQPYSYMVFSYAIGVTTWYAAKASNGSIIIGWSSANASYVLTSVTDSLSLGGKVHIGKGIFNYDTTWLLKYSSIIVDGEGAGNGDTGTLLNFTGTGNGINLVSATAPYPYKAYIQLSDITLQGTSSADYGIYFDYISGSKLSYVYVSGFGKAGLYYNNSYMNFVEYCSIYDCNQNEADGYEIYLSTDNNWNTFYATSVTNTNGRGAVFCLNSADVLFSHVNVELANSGYGQGIVIQGGVSCVVRDSHFENNGHDVSGGIAIDIYGGYGHVVQNNFIYDTNGTGIMVRNSAFNTNVMNNDISGSDTQDVYVQAGSNGTLLFANSLRSITSITNGAVGTNATLNRDGTGNWLVEIP